MGLLIGIALAAAATAAAPAHDPLAPARAGKLQCYQPDTARRTCVATGAYVWAADGAIANLAEVLVATGPTVIMKSSTPVTVKADAVCGVLSAADIRAAEFIVDGQPATPEMTEKVRNALVTSLPDIGREVCTEYTPTSDGRFMAAVRVDGALRPALSATVIWIGPEDRYRVAP